MFTCPLTNKSNSAAIKSPETRKFRMAAYTRNSLDAELIYHRKLWCEDFNIQQSSPLIHRFQHCERSQALGEWAAERLRAPGVYRVKKKRDIYGSGSRSRSEFLCVQNRPKIVLC